MALVAYSDSEGSDDEQPSVPAPKTVPKPEHTNQKFSVDRADPTKIRVNLGSVPGPTSERPDGEPAAKRPRVGAGTFSGFNSMLPAPKRDNIPTKPQNGAKPAVRKVFSLKTGAEPAFSRESDAELKQLFAEQSEGSPWSKDAADNTIPSVIPKPSSVDAEGSQTTIRKPLMFKPLSVARNNKKKKPVSSQSKAPVTEQNVQPSTKPTIADPPEPKKKVSLFSVEPDHENLNRNDRDQDEDGIVEVLPDEEEESNPYADTFNTTSAYRGSQVSQTGPQTLENLATDLKLSAADRRQLFGRQGNSKNAMPSNIINFNTDREYAANQELIAAGEQIQHNPVRAIAPGKHSLKQLVASAQGQKDALEESFASGRRNKREAGSKYGW